MNLNVDGGTTADSIIMLVMILSFSLILRNPELIDFIPLGLSYALTALLDPDYLGFILFATLILTIFLIFFKINNKKSIYIWFYSFLLFIPFFVFVYWGLNFNNIGNSYIYSLRPLSPWISTNISKYPWSPFVLLGYYWATMTFGPPSIIFYSNKIHTLPGLMYPTQVILPPDILSIIWLISIFSIPLIAFSSIVFKKTRKLMISLALMLVIFFILIFYYQIPPLLYVFKCLISIPILGGAIETSLSIPDHMLMVIASGYVILLTIFLVNIISENESKKIKINFKKLKIKSLNTIKFFIVIFIIFIILFSGWQAFNGNYYPARSNYSSFFGNGVANGGAYEPFKVPNDVYIAYNKIIQDHSLFNVYWPVLYGHTLPQSTSNTIPLKLGLLSYFPELVKNNLRYDIIPYMNSEGVKYLVIENITYIPPDLFAGAYYKNLSSLFYFYYGMYNYYDEIKFLKSIPDLSLIYYTKNISVFENMKFNGAIYNASLLLNYRDSNSFTPMLYSLFNSMNISSIATNYLNYGVNTTINQLNKTINILTPSFLINYNKPNIFINSTTLKGNVTFLMNHSKGQYSYQIGPYNVGLWNGNISGAEENGSFIFESKENSTVTLSIFSQLTNGQTAIPLPERNGTYIVKFSTSLYWSDTSTEPMISIYGNNESLISSFTSGMKVTRGEMNKNIEVSWAVPNNIRYVTVRVGGSFQGLLKINYYNISIYFIPNNSTLNLPLSYACYLLNFNQKISLPINNENNYVYIYFKGLLNINSNLSLYSINYKWYEVKTGNFLNLSLNGSIASIIIVKNNSLNNYFKNIVVNTIIVSNNLMVSQKGKNIYPIPSVEGFAIYILFDKSTYIFNYLNFYIADFINIIIIVSIYFLFIYYLYLKIYKKQH
ncbi:MAG: hypothetical protein ACP5IB_07545 [Thermoplasmata archaeon]